MYAEVILPLDLRERYHYRLAPKLEARGQDLVGSRAIVSFGSKRFYTGIIRSVGHEPPKDLPASKIKLLNDVLDETPLVSTTMLEQWTWVSEYYMCSLGSVLRTAVPHGLLPESTTVIFATPDFEAKIRLSDIEIDLLDLLHQTPDKQLTLSTLQSRLGRANLSKVCSRLISLGAIYSDEAMKTSYKPRPQRLLRLSEDWQIPERHDELLLTLRRAPKQQALMVELLERFGECGLNSSLPRREVMGLKGASQAIVSGLIAKGCLIEETGQISRLTTSQTSRPITPQALPKVVPLTKPTTLLYSHSVGIKEDLLLSYIKQTLERGEQVLLLTPSAYGLPSATAWLHRLEEISPEGFYHYHTMTSEAVRVEVYNTLARSEAPCLVLGNRSSLFLPLSRLGLIIVDEEHEYMYKQQHSAPRFHARDLAVWMSSKLGCKVLLSSETPSADVLFNTLRGKYDIIHSPRPTKEDARMTSHIEVIDLSTERKKRSMKFGHGISPRLQEAVNKRLQAGKRSLLLHNRKGYAPYLLCHACGERIRCLSCDVSLHYFQSLHRLSCSYCGYTKPLPSSCPSCGSSEISTPWGMKPALGLMGQGSERIEEEAKTLWPERNVVRIDSVSLQSNKRVRELSEQIEADEVDIVVGTQLIKGQPIWDDLDLIGVIQLEAILGLPDFRADERAFQLLYQLRMRTLEHRTEGSDSLEIILQTTDTTHPFIEDFRSVSYSDFIKKVLQERKALSFPPFTRMSYIVFKSFDPSLVEACAQQYHEFVRHLASHSEVMPVQCPTVGRIDGQYIRRIMMRRPYSVGYKAEREAMREAEQLLRERHPEYNRVRIDYDIDPL